MFCRVVTCPLTSGAYFSLNGAVYSPGEGFQVAADQLSQLQYIPGALGSTDTLTVTGFDGFALGNATTISLPVVAPNTAMFQPTDANREMMVNEPIQNSYTRSSDGSYSDTWSNSSAAGSYWWNASTEAYQESWHDSNGASWTDDYQYASGGSPGGSGVSFTETYTYSNGDQGTRQYDASTGATTLSWYSSATGTITGTVTDSARRLTIPLSWTS